LIEFYNVILLTINPIGKFIRPKLISFLPFRSDPLHILHYFDDDPTASDESMEMMNVDTTSVNIDERCLDDCQHSLIVEFEI